ncbi:hypothetical protein DL764_004817 [Monosporascus ibericus]|uniref:Uncharacterized protein n=1 Tax=Monosporascus ibericus TaxID=155417 RepID=A0A4Q4TB78_9PEZI|nr:hypothetical protein DL764_004817 [Monosporascus ibericus]
MPSRQSVAAAGLALLATALPSVTAMPGLPFKIEAREPPRALPERATADDKKWQPAMDFDTDGCYNTPAIDANGNIAEGLDPWQDGNSGGCRDESDLDNNNVYSRQRCNNGWCAYIYDYYFEKDTALGGLGGHRHDWEHIAVWVQNGEAKFVSASQHGDYETKAAQDVRWEGTHPKMVYHKDGISTHCFRFANQGDDAIENHKGVWFYGALISWNGFPSTQLRDKLMSADFGSASIGIKDSSFQSQLNTSRGNRAPEFDSALDVGSPGNP